ncbi:MAG: hypothetical protein MJ248_06355 [Bacilli bacterium]|nr:hypothetical protein [Bacilli bacterium]
MQIASLIIAVITVLGIIFSTIFFPSIKIKNFKIATFWVIALLGAAILLAIQSVSFETVWNGFTAHTSINPIKILVLFLSMTFLSIFLDVFGFFKYIANKFANKFSKNQYTLFFGLYFIISLLTVFTSNDIIILTFTPFICYFAKRCNIKAHPYLIMEFVAANTWSMCLIIGNPTNIYLATSFNVAFFDYFIKMIIPTIIASLVSLTLLFLVFRKELKGEIVVNEQDDIKLEKLPVIFGVVILSMATIMLAISSYIQLEMWYLSLGFAGILLVFLVIYSIIKKTNYVLKVLKKLPWNLIPFVLSMFVIVLAINNQGLLDYLSNFLLIFNNTFSYGLSGVIAANLINNIPMSVLYSAILGGATEKAMYASIIASNIAAYITPIGALAGIMFMELTKSLDSKISFLEFLKYGVLIGIPTIVIAITALEFIV